MAGPNGNRSGQSYVVFGKDTADVGNFSASFDLASLTSDTADGSQGFVIKVSAQMTKAGFRYPMPAMSMAMASLI